MEDNELATISNNISKLAQIIDDALSGKAVYHNEIDPKELQLGELIGRGAAGKVYRYETSCEIQNFERGKYKDRVVAVKQYSEDNITFDLEEFRKELTIMRYMHVNNISLLSSVLDHENLIRCIGACTKDMNQLYIVTDLLPGSLASYLSSNSSFIIFAF